MANENTKHHLDLDHSTGMVYTVSPNFTAASNGVGTCLAINNENTPLKTDQQLSKKENLNFTIHVYKGYKIEICKPLLPLKLAQFCWFGAGSYMVAFLTVFLKQRGVSLSELSWMNVIAPVVQLLGTTLTGIIADKTGKSKPVLIANLLIVMVMIVGIILMPSMKDSSCEPQTMNSTCYIRTSNRRDNCDVPESTIGINSCNLNCPISNVDDVADKTSMIPSFKQESKSSIFNKSCYYDTARFTHSIPITWCGEIENKTCQVVCTVVTNSSCRLDSESKNILLIGYITLYVFYVTTYSNIYRCFDVTAMALANEHNADFGRERFFAIAGNLVVSPLAGFLADVTTVPGGETNYQASFYLFIGMVCLVIIILYKLPVSVNAPGQKMWKKSFSLCKSPDVLSFAVVILVLGTAWNFTKTFVFWYLEELKSPSILIGLIPSASALYGLPFLLTSNWWVKKIGCPHLFILAFCGYVVKCVGYSFIANPWYSLILEGVGGITYYLLWVAVVLHSHELAPEGLRATVIAVAGAIHYSVGKASGGLVGGLVMNSYGGKVAFRLIAIICFVSSILYWFYLRLRVALVTKTLQIDDLNTDKIHSKEPNCNFILQKEN